MQAYYEGQIAKKAANMRSKYDNRANTHNRQYEQACTTIASLRDEIQKLKSEAGRSGEAELLRANKKVAELEEESHTTFMQFREIQDKLNRITAGRPDKGDQQVDDKVPRHLPNGMFSLLTQTILSSQEVDMDNR